MFFPFYTSLLFSDLFLVNIMNFISNGNNRELNYSIYFLMHLVDKYVQNILFICV